MADALGILGTVADLAGLATTIGAQAPGLKKARKRDTSARAARAGGMQTAAAAVGGAQTGFGASRGLALRSGLRGASNAARGAADAASTAAAQDEQRFVQERDARNARLAQFGKDIGGFAGQVGQGVSDVIAAKGAQPVGGEVALPDQASVMGIDPVTGLEIPAEQEPQPAALQQGMQLQPPGDLQMPQAQDPNLGGQQLQQPMMAPPTTAMEAYQAAMGIQPNVVYQVAPAMEYKLRVTNLAVEEAERLGIQPSQVIAPLLRQLNINPMDLHGVDPGGLMDEDMDGGY